jgi:hypothetical protein
LSLGRVGVSAPSETSHLLAEEVGEGALVGVRWRLDDLRLVEQRLFLPGLSICTRNWLSRTLILLANS